MHNRIIVTSAALLIVVGVGGYFGSNMVSLTALIPTVLGALMLGANAAASRGSGLVAQLWVPLVALFGVAGTARAIPAFFASLFSDPSGLTLPTVGRSLTAIISLVALVAAVLRWRATRQSES